MVKVMVATKETQRKRKNDFCWADEGEIVVRGMECDRDGEDIDGECGCKRSMVGVRTRKATTTMKVVELRITKKEVKDQIRQSLVDAGWAGLMGKKETEDTVNDSFKEITELSNYFGAGAIVEKRGNTFKARVTCR